MIEPLCRGHQCIVVGSAPGVTLPDPEPGDVILGANGGAAIARNAGREVHVLCTTAYLFRPGASRQELATLAELRDLSVESLWIDETDGSAIEAQRRARFFGITWKRARGVHPDDRARLVESVVGEPLRVSTGVFAASLAVASGASEIVVCGVDPSLHGHEGMSWDQAQRDHAIEDAVALTSLRTSGQVELTRQKEAARC